MFFWLDIFLKFLNLYHVVVALVHVFLHLVSRARRNEPTIKGTIIFDANSTISISPVNFQ